MTTGIAGELGARVAAGRFADSGAATAVDFLRQGLRISAVEASRRLALARQVLPVPDPITGQSRPVRQPDRAAALARGELGANSARIVSTHVGQAADL